MRFVPVPITGGPSEGKTIRFSVWETRVKDYAEFVKDEKRDWPKPDFAQGDDHPAVMVSWEDATAFCAWLTKEERRKRKIGPKDVYRLPTDHEWSCAVGIGKEEDAAAAPAAKDVKITRYPWGVEFPPPKGAGNYSGEETKRTPVSGQRPIPGYDDGSEPDRAGGQVRCRCPRSSRSQRKCVGVVPGLVRSGESQLAVFCVVVRGTPVILRLCRRSRRLSNAPLAFRYSTHGGFRVVLEVGTGG